MSANVDWPMYFMSFVIFGGLIISDSNGCTRIPSYKQITNFVITINYYNSICVNTSSNNIKKEKSLSSKLDNFRNSSRTTFWQYLPVRIFKNFRSDEMFE